jgi:broad specificity phosphatase PhoE
MSTHQLYGTWFATYVIGPCLFMLLLVVIATKLGMIRKQLLPDSSQTASIVQALTRKAKLVAYGSYFLVLSKDAVSSKDLKRARANAEELPPNAATERHIRLIFVRHGESVWNYVFNRGFGPSFLVRLLRVTLHELYLLPFEDSAYLDSPLSEEGLEQCIKLQAFLRKPCVDLAASQDFAALTTGEGSSLIVSSQLRRAACTIAIALSDRLRRSREAVVLHSACQEISRNFDTLALALPSCSPPLDAVLEVCAPGARFESKANAGNKTLAFRGIARLEAFATWAADRPESTIIVGGHSLWFRSFFARFLTGEHQAAKRKIVNCGVVACTLIVARSASGGVPVQYRIEPSSVTVVYGGFESKG